jgi:hypothetical protein
VSFALKLFLVGAAFFSSILAAHEYPPEAKSTRTEVTVHVVFWLPSFNATDHFCSFLNGQKVDPTSEEMTLGCFEPYTITIYVVEPRNFNDYLHLEILGHEFWHALGATHPD